MVLIVPVTDRSRLLHCFGTFVILSLNKKDLLKKRSSLASPFLQFTRTILNKKRKLTHIFSVISKKNTYPI